MRGDDELRNSPTRQFTIAPWSHSSDTAHVVFDGAHLPSTWRDASDLTNELADLTSRLHIQGYATVRTGALHGDASRILGEFGFKIYEELVLLKAFPAMTQLHSKNYSTQHQVVRVPRRQTTRPDFLAQLSQIDQSAFGPHATLDENSLLRAIRATTHHKVFVVSTNGVKLSHNISGLVGFALAGYTGETGFIQRLAVHPSHQRNDMGYQLISQSMSWFARHKIKQVLVNTAITNVAARTLYERCGFSEESERLVAMEHRAQVAAGTSC